MKKPTHIRNFLTRLSLVGMIAIALLTGRASGDGETIRPYEWMEIKKSDHAQFLGGDLKRDTGTVRVISAFYEMDEPWPTPTPVGHKTYPQVDVTTSRQEPTPTPFPNEPLARWTLTDGDGNVIEGTQSQTLLNVPTGTITVEWGHVEGYQTPSGPRTRSLGHNDYIEFHGTYEKLVGFVEIHVNVDSATWTLTDGTGEIHSGIGSEVIGPIAVGPVSIEWGDVPNHDSPRQTAPVMLDLGSQVFIEGIYSRHTGSVQVTTIPGVAPWSIMDGDGNLLDGIGTTLLQEVPTGEITISWEEFAGYERPEPLTESIQLSRGELASFEGIYTIPTSNAQGSLTILIEPEAANLDGAGWRVAGEDLWRLNGETIEVPAGIPILEARDIDWWQAGVVNFGPSWAWVGGEEILDSQGDWGQLGVPGTGLPSGRTGMMITPDSEGNFWLFAGAGPDGPELSNLLNDLWHYDISTNLWTWVSGANHSADPGSYGTRGTPHSNNRPPMRTRGAIWSGPEQTIWVFGGFHPRNDLWRYDIQTGMWTWMKGTNQTNSDGVYGSKGVPNINNTPASTYDAAYWPTIDGKLWLYGGRFATSNIHDDLWCYDIASNTWTWMNGSGDPFSSDWETNKPMYGTRGVGGANNSPGRRWGSSTWLTEDGGLWLFGGYGRVSTHDPIEGSTLNVGRFADLWRYDIPSNEWTWVAGPAGHSLGGRFGEFGVPYQEHFHPAGRYWSNGWVGSNNDLWLYGGSGHDIHAVQGDLNDLWRFDISAGTWAWLGGSIDIRQQADFGALGHFSPDHQPGARRLATTVDVDGKHFLFGGISQYGSEGFHRRNDLWQLEIGALVPLDGMTTSTIVYSPVGLLQINILPEEANNDGALWSIDGGEHWHPDGDSIIIPEGEYTITFAPIMDRKTPDDITTTVLQYVMTTVVGFYNSLPEVVDLGIFPDEPRTLDEIQAVFTTFDADGHEIIDVEVEWYLGDSLMATGEFLSPGLTSKGQGWELRVRLRDSHGDWGEVAVHPFTIRNTLPTAPIVEIRPNNPTASNDLAVDVIQQSVDADGDPIAYDFEWWVSRDNGDTWTFRADLLFSPVVSNLLIFEGDIWRIDVIPYERQQNKQESSEKTNRGNVGSYQVYVGENTPPQITITRATGLRRDNGMVDLMIQWTWFDADGQNCVVNLSWTDLGGFGINPIAFSLDAATGAHSTSAFLPRHVPLHIFAVITDEKGAMTQVTSGPVLITDEEIEVEYFDSWMIY